MYKFNSIWTPKDPEFAHRLSEKNLSRLRFFCSCAWGSCA